MSTHSSDVGCEAHTAAPALLIRSTAFVACCLALPPVSPTGALAAQSPAPDTIWTQEARTPVWGSAIRRLAPSVQIGDANDSHSFGRIARIVPGPAGQVVVVDREPEGPAITIWSADGRLTGSCGSYGEGPREFRSGVRVAFSGRDTLVMLDERLGRLSVWTSSGKHLSDTPLRELVPGGRVMALHNAPSGKAWISEQWYPGPPDPLVAAWSHLARRYRLLDLRTKRLETPSSERFLPEPIPKVPFGPRIYRVPLLSGQIATVLSERVGFAVPDPGGRRVAGRWVAVPEVRVAAPERTEQERLRDLIRETSHPVFRPPPMTVPTAKQPVTDASVGADGRIWLRLATEGVRGAAVLAYETTASSRQAYLQYRDRFWYAGFEPDGRFLGIVELPGDYSRVEFGPGAIWAVETDADGLETLVRFDLPRR